MTSSESTWLQTVMAGSAGYETEAIARYSAGLIHIARQQLPRRLQGRTDPEDIVQSVFLSFFARNEQGQFQFESANDIWKLLCALTYRKSINAIKHHSRQQRDVRRESNDSGVNGEHVMIHRAEPTASDAASMVELFEQLVADLPEKSKRIVCLRLEGYELSEIAARVGVSYTTIKRVLRRVRVTADAIAGETFAD